MTSFFTSINADNFAKYIFGMCTQLHSTIGAEVGGGITIPFEITIETESLANSILLRVEFDLTQLSMNSITLELTICGAGDLQSPDTTRKEWLSSLTKSLENLLENYAKGSPK